MPEVRIQEHAKLADGWQVKVSFDHKVEYYATIRTSTLALIAEQDLVWYFEKYPNLPFSKSAVKVSGIINSIKAYGETLFEDIFGNRDVYVEYSRIRDNGLSNLQIEIASNTPQFHALHWEALKDPQRPLPLALQSTMIRQNLKPPSGYASLLPSPTINLLIVTARPYGKNDPDYRAISRPLVRIWHKQQTKIHILRPGTFKALQNHLRDIENDTGKGRGYYHVIHLDMHGIVCSYDELKKTQELYQFTERYGSERASEIQEYENFRAFLLFESEIDHKADLVDQEELHKLLKTYQIPIAILNACQSGKQVGERETSLGSWLMLAGFQLVLAMGYSVSIQAAERFMSTLYKELLKCKDLYVAIRQARNELANDKKRDTPLGKAIELQDWLLPIIYQNERLQLNTRDFTDEESNAYFVHKQEMGEYLQKKTFNEFVGRDIDILQIEKRLLIKCNILLVWGGSGIGKTTLFQHLGIWWSITDFIQKYFYFDFNEKAWTLQEIVNDIAKACGEKYNAKFLSLSEKARPAKLIQDLSGSRYLLILDHLEALTGTHLIGQHRMAPEEQNALHSFLKQLAGGQTLVLLGSHNDEVWLKEGTFNDNIYQLSPLDFEASSDLAKYIMKKNQTEKYHPEEDFQRLLHLLGGFPLAIEVVLAYLTKQTPKEILKALDADGEENKESENDNSNGQQNAIDIQNIECIAYCVGYVYKRFSSELQKMLLFLAPFVKILQEPMLVLYLPYLQKESALTNLPFSHWLEIIQEAQGVGLLIYDLDIPQILHLHPAFSYFLQKRLVEVEFIKEKQAIETAFLLLYEQISNTMYQQLSSEDPNKSRVIQKLISLEYANLETALHLALQAQVSISAPFQVLFKYLDMVNDPSRGLQLAQTILSDMEKYPIEKREGSLCRDYIDVISKIAYQHAMIRQYAEAEKIYQRLLSLLLKLEHLNEYERNKWEADVCHELGNLAFEQNQLPEAENHYKKALQIKENLGDSRSLVITYKKLGDLAQQQKNISDADGYYQKALGLFVKLNDRHFQALICIDLGNVALLQQQPQLAKAYYAQALQMFQQLDEHHYVAQTYLCLGELALEQLQWERAEDYYQQVLQIYAYLNDEDAHADIYLQLDKIAKHNKR